MLDNQRIGIWSLTAPSDLLHKLNVDLRRMQESPGDALAAYDFFVTAYHMHEWLARDASHKTKLESAPLVRVAGEIATRAKHFRADNPKWVTLGVMGARMPGPLSRTPRGIPTPLWVGLQDPSLTPIGRDIVRATQLAQCLVDHWTSAINNGGDCKLRCCAP